MVSMIALIFAFFRANVACWWIAHEPPMPEEVKKMRFKIRK
ncbi:cyclic lactone autoinducer peptide [Paenibacillus macerans]